MKRLLRTSISLLLTFLLITTPPLSSISTAYAATTADAVTELPVSQSINQVNPHFGEPEDGELTVGHTNREAEIVKEDETKRDKYIKEFILSDNSRMIALYSSAVHYEDDNAWKEIDNSLESVQVDGKAVLRNKANAFNVNLPQQLNNQAEISIENKGFTLGFTLKGKKTLSADKVITPVVPSVIETEPADLVIEDVPSVIEIPSAEEEINIFYSPEEHTEEMEVLDSFVEEFVQDTEPSENNAQTALMQFDTLTLEEVTSVTAEVLNIVGSTASSAATDDTATIQAVAENAEETTQGTLPSNLDSAVLYSSVYQNVDVRYDVAPESLKESIVLSQLPAGPELYTFQLRAEGMDLVNTEDGIYAYDSADPSENREAVFFMPAPFMADNAGEYSDDVQVLLTEKQDGLYELNYLPDYDWLCEEDRAWPVIIDPVVNADLDANNIRDTMIASSYETNSLRAYIECGWHKYKGIERIFLMYDNLPALTSADVITNATVQIYREYDSDVISQVNVHKVLEPWVAAELQWENRPGYNTIIEDYTMVQNIGWYVWDITTIVQGWYDTGVNTGMMFKLPDSIEEAGGTTTNNKTFASSDCGQYFRPVLYVTYTNNCGIESYWDYHTQSAGRAGTGYVNDFTGNLAFVRSDLGVSGNLMPVAIQHTYNANDKETNLFGCGYGWRTNYNQLVYQWEADTDYYIWEDGDGTKHYFKYASSNTYKDEDGLEMTLTTSTDTSYPYVITDKLGNKSKFDSQGRLARLENNQATVSANTITYIDSTSKLISTIKDGVNRVYEYNYTDGLLSSMVYKGTGTTALQTLTYTYNTNSEMTGVTYQDGESVSYAYGANHLLTTVTDIDGIELNYQYNTTSTSLPNRVSGISTRDGDVEGGSLSIAYTHNQTTFTDHDGYSITEQFNNKGNTICIQDDQGFAQYAKYATDENETNKANQLTLSSKLQNTVKNYLLNHSCEYEEGWVTYENGFTYSNTQSYMGAKSIQLTGVSGQRAGAKQTFTLAPGKTYVFSGYVKTSAAEDAHLNIDLGEEVVSSESISGTEDWQRIEVSLPVPEGSADVSISFVAEIVGGGSAWFDCLQVEEAATASRYNLLENSDFTYAGDKTYIALHWAEGNGCTYPEKRMVADFASAAPHLDNVCYTATGAVNLDKRIYQDVTVSGEAGDVYTITGWAKGDSAPLKTSDRDFGIIVRFYNTDNTQTERYMAFNPDTSLDNKWQYAAERIIADKPYTMIRVLCIYHHNVNPVYFDGIQLFQEEFGYSYVYDENGNVVSASDIADTTSSHSFSNNNLAQSILPGASVHNYIYDDYHNPISLTTGTNITTRLSYHNNGNLTQAVVGNTSPQIVVNAQYTADGNYFSAITDSLRQTTHLGIDSDRGQINWLRLPGDTASSQTNYSYDEFTRLLSIERTTSDTTSRRVQYTYDNDRVKTVDTGTTVYTNSYGPFGLHTGISAGTKRLVTYEYDVTNKSYLLERIVFGNGDNIEYDYDNLHRVSAIYYDDETSPSVVYTYDNMGGATVITDYDQSLSTKMLYDFADRLNYVSEKGIGDNTLNHTYKWTFDERDNISQITETLGTTTQDIEYIYNKDDILTTIKFDDYILHHNLDFAGRTQTSTVSNETATLFTTNYQYYSPDSAHTTKLPSTITYTNTSFNRTLSYLYDSWSNIVSTSYNGYNTHYTYDSQNRLIREDNQRANKSWIWTYDNNGNVLQEKEYLYSSGTLGDMLSTNIYHYEDEYGWGDILTSVNENTYHYDSIGNLVSDGTWNYSWSKGRQLDSMSNDTTTILYKYDSDGKRTQKTLNDNITRYIYVDNKISHEIRDTGTLFYRYDSYGQPLSFNYNGADYFYILNPQHDIVGIVDSTGNIIVEYSYDSWGNIISITGSHSESIGQINPYRYRSYYYDTETNLYFVGVRYYSPYLHRFINADSASIINISLNTLSNKNLFSYCENNPIAYIDSTGYYIETVFDVATLIVSIAECAANPADPLNWVGLAGDVVDVLIPLGGVGEGVRAIKVVNKAADSSDTVIDAAKAISRSQKNNAAFTSAVGSYEIEFQSGKAYVGKGGWNRAITSATEKSKTYSDPVTKITWEPAATKEAAYIDEYKKQVSHGGVGKQQNYTYNKIWSPGKKIYERNNVLKRGAVNHKCALDRFDD